MAISRSTGQNIRDAKRRFPEGVTVPDAMGLAGTIAELQVCNVLLSRGFHVFRALVNNSPCDLVAMVGSALFRVEVKSVRSKASGELVYKSKNALDTAKFDLLAQVIDGTDLILFTPDLDELEAVGRVRTTKGRK